MGKGRRGAEEEGVEGRGKEIRERDGMGKEMGLMKGGGWVIVSGVMTVGVMCVHGVCFGVKRHMSACMLMVSAG